MAWNLVVSVLSIVVIDVVLSGDNALVIGMASHRLTPRLRRWAIIFGGAGAISLRVLFTIAAVFLLAVPFLQAVGGLLLTGIAFRLLSQEDAEGPAIQATDSLIGAVQTIVLADVVMSIDNILAVGGAAHGSIELLIFGLLLSMPLILFGSSLIATLMNRLPWLVTVGAVVLSITAARMIVDDRIVANAIPHGWHPVALGGLAAVLTLAVVGPVLLRRLRAQGRDRAADETVSAGSGQGEADRRHGS